MITQLFFVNEEFFRFREKAALAGINAPIIAGLMPIGSLAQIQRIGSLCGAKIPASLVQAIENAASPEEARAIGIEYSTVQCAELLREGVDGIHFYTLNRSTATRAIWARLTGGTPPEWTE